MATHSSILAWEIPWTEESGRQQSMGSQTIYLGFPGGSMVKNPSAIAGDAGSTAGLGRSPWRRKWQFTPVFLPGKSHRGAWWAIVYGVKKELDTTGQLNDTSRLLCESLSPLLLSHHHFHKEYYTDYRPEKSIAPTPPKGPVRKLYVGSGSGEGLLVLTPHQ